MRFRSAVAAVALGAMLLGCGEPPQVGGVPEHQRGPVDDAPERPARPGNRLRPEVVQARPEIAAYGGELTLEFSEPTSRGRDYALERREGDDWVWVFSMTSDAHSATWWYAGADIDVPDDVYTDTEVAVPVPHRSVPGEYRICTSAGDCAAVAIGPPADAEVCRSEPGSPTEVLTEPGWRGSADYREWTDEDGCLVRVDVLADNRGPEHCNLEGVRVLMIGTPIGERFSSLAGAASYLRDPDGLLDDPSLAAAHRVDAPLPGDAVDTGFRHADTQLWAAPGGSYLYLVRPDATEWIPRGDAIECA